MNRKRKKIPAMLVAAAQAADKSHEASTQTGRQNAPAQKAIPVLRAALAGVTGFALVLALSHVVNAEDAAQPFIKSPAVIDKGKDFGQKNT